MEINVILSVLDMEKVSRSGSTSCIEKYFALEPLKNTRLSNLRLIFPQ